MQLFSFAIIDIVYYCIINIIIIITIKKSMTQNDLRMLMLNTNRSKMPTNNGTEAVVVNSLASSQTEGLPH